MDYRVFGSGLSTCVGLKADVHDLVRIENFFFFFEIIWCCIVRDTPRVQQTKAMAYKNPNSRNNWNSPANYEKKNPYPTLAKHQTYRFRANTRLVPIT